MEEVEQIKTQTPQSLSLSNFQSKAIFFAIFVVFLPFFSSHAPDFVKQVLSNKIWELFHLLLVGIAVSYGLFSRKGGDQETEKVINATEPVNPQSYISDILHGLPVFDSNEPDNPNVQSWSSMYNPNEPLVVVENEIVEAKAQNINKPLLLPIRSLNPLAREPNLHGQRELFQNDGDAEKSESTNEEEEEEKGDIFKPPTASKSAFRSFSAKESNNGRKITPENFKCEQNRSSSVGRSGKTVRSKSSSSMEDFIKTMEDQSESDESFNGEEESSNSSSCVTEDGLTEDNEVDKKADEFIAKFREQIRLQRMQCRKRSNRK